MPKKRNEEQEQQKNHTADIDHATNNDTLNLALDTIKIGKQALIFVGSKRSAEKSAEDIARKVKDTDLSPETKEKCAKAEQEILNALSRPTHQCERLAACAKKGIAFHHSGITSSQRESVETGFRQGTIKIICCTPTLAAGVDLPAFRAIIKDLKRFSSSGWGGMQFIPVLEYLQMAGRAGRPKYDSYGEAICIAPTQADKEEITERYIHGEPEEIFSKLAVEPVLRTYLLSLIASNFVKNHDEIMDFFSRTFWAYQFKDMEKLESIIFRMLRLLEGFGFITTEGREEGSEFISAHELEEKRLRATLIGKRVAELYIDPLTAHHIITCLKKETDDGVTAFALLQTVSHTLEMRPLLKVKVKEYDTVMEEYAKHESDLLDKEPSIYEPEYEDFISSVKTALFLNEWIDEKDDEYLLDKYDVRPGETRVKIDKADWLLYTAEEFARLLQRNNVIKDIVKLRFRLKYGVREELIPLLKLQGIGRVRARKLYGNGIKDIGDVKRADIATLAQLIGKAVALDVKKQVGEDIAKELVPENKRKGQISLKDYGND
jgi:helicase